MEQKKFAEPTPTPNLSAVAPTLEMRIDQVCGSGAIEREGQSLQLLANRWISSRTA